MENFIKTFSLHVKNDKKSILIADRIRQLNLQSQNPLEEVEEGDLIIAIGGDGTFLDAVTSTGFSQKKIYTGVHTGTLGFLQDLSKNDIYTLINHIHYHEELKTRKVYTALVTVYSRNHLNRHFYALNEALIVGESHSKISFNQYVNGELLQNVTGNGIVISTSTGDTAYSMNAGGAIDFSNNFQLVCTLETPIRNAAYDRFITNSIICNNIELVLKPSENINLIIDGQLKSVDSLDIEKIDVSMLNESYINKLDIMNFSKVSVIREKILGY